MPSGTIKKMVHLAQQTHLLNAGLVPGRNEHGYGIISDENGHDVYFSHEIVAGRSGFDGLRKGQEVEFTLEEAPYRRADWVGLPPKATATGFGD